MGTLQKYQILQRLYVPTSNETRVFIWINIAIYFSEINQHLFY